MKNEGEIWWMYSTFPHREEALSVARKLLENKLIACANIVDGATSLYHWEGALCEEKEVLMFAKTTQGRRHAAREMLCSLHSYDVPALLLIPAPEGNENFMDWVRAQLA